MWVGIGIGINRNRFARGIFNAYSARVVSDGGVVESGTCVDAVSSLLQSASLLLIPSGYKGGKLYAEIPTNGNGDLTWTRGGDAFRTNASGVIQRVPWNLLQQSETFDNAVWTKVVSINVDTNVTVSPNGTLSADRLRKNLTSLQGINQSINYTSTGSYVESIYAKADSTNFIQFTDSTNPVLCINLTNGNVSANNGIFTNVSVTNVGDGWYLIRYTRNRTSTGSQATLYCWPSDISTLSFSTTSSTCSCFIWGAQLVEGTTAQTYLPTTDRLNFPRLSYLYGSCPSALLEPQRTNLALWSEDFSQTTWAKTRCSITANSTTAPDGNTTADTLVEDTTATSTHPVSQAVTLTAAAQTFSIYAKAANRNWIQLTLLSTANASAYFNLSNGTIGTVGSATTASIQSVGNGWYRCIITATTAAGANTLGIYPASADATSSFTGNGTASLYIWGAQCE